MGKPEEIKAIAYRLWEEDGRPSGRELAHYYRAEAIYQQQHDLTAPTGDTVQPGAGNAGTPAQHTSREEAAAYEGHHQQAGHHRRRRGDHHQSTQ